MNRRFIKFAVVGTSGTLIDLGLFALLIWATPLGGTSLGRISAASISFVAAVINNFYWNRCWTFNDHAQNVKNQFYKFFIVSCGGWLLHVFIFTVLSLSMPSLLAKICSSAAVLVYNYSANRRWTFNSSA